MLQAYEAALSVKENSMARIAKNPAFDAVGMLINAAKRHNCNLTALVAETALWANPGIHMQLQQGGSIAWHPNIRRARKGNGEKKGQVINCVRLDDNSYANAALKRVLGFSRGELVGFETCHIWPDTCYDVRYHTAIANLVLLPRALAGLSDHHGETMAALQFRACELYDWHPEEKERPSRPLSYPSCWREPEPIPNGLRYPR